MYCVTGYSYKEIQEYDPEFGEAYMQEIQDDEHTEKISWNELFFTIAPEAYKKSSEISFRKAINTLVEQKLAIENFRMSDTCYNTIKFQFKFLGLVNLYNTFDIEDTIKLTLKGKNRYLNTVVVKKNKD